MKNQYLVLDNFAQQNTTFLDYDQGPILMCYGINPNNGIDAYPEYSLSTITATSTLSALNSIPYQIVYNSYSLSTGLYGLTENGRLFYSTDPSSSWDYIHANSNAQGKGMALYNNYLYYASNNAVGRFDFNATYSDSWNALNGVNPTYHPMKVFAGNLLIGDGRYVAMYDGSTFSANALDIPPNMSIRWLEVLLDRIMICADAPVGSVIYTWDGYSPSYLQAIPVIESRVLGGINHKNSLFVITDRGEIRQYTGAGFQTVKVLPLIDQESTITIYPTSIQSLGDDILFAVSSSLEDDKYVRLGIYGYNTKTGVIYLKHEHQSEMQVIGSTAYGYTTTLLPYGSNVVTGGIELLSGSTQYQFGYPKNALRTHTTEIWFNPKTSPGGYIKLSNKQLLSIRPLLTSDATNKITLTVSNSPNATGVSKVPANTSTTTRLDITSSALSNFGLGVGDEVWVTAGPQAGEFGYITAIDESGSTRTYTLDTTFTTSLASAVEVQVRPFKKIGELTGGTTVDTKDVLQFIGRVRGEGLQYRIIVTKDVTVTGFSAEYHLKRGGR